MTDQQLVAASDLVVRGRVRTVRVERRPRTGVIETVAQVEVTDDYTGSAPTVIEVREIGGVIGDTRLVVPGAAQLLAGDDLVLMLERHETSYRPIAMGHTTFGVRATASGVAAWRQGEGATGSGSSAGPSRQSLAALSSVITSVTGRAPMHRTPRESSSSSATDGTSPTVGSYTLLGQMRWNEADTGGTVLWYRNTLTPAPLSSGSGDSQLQTATSAWTTPEQGTITLAFGGSRFHSAASLLNCSSPPVPGGGLVTFEDPNDDITTAGVIAIGGACSTSSGGKTVNGLTFSRITYGFVIFSTKAEVPSLADSLFFTRVATHEIGHAIGLGHTQTNGTVSAATSNIMYPSCCHTATPVPPALGQDDLGGLAQVYPSSTPVDCTATVTPTSFSVGATGGAAGTASVSIDNSCSWSIGTPPTWLTFSGSSLRTGPGAVALTATSNPGVARSGQLTVAGRTVSIAQSASPPAPPPTTPTPSPSNPLDTDGDGLPDAWEMQAGLDPTVATGANGAAGDPDGDGLSNLEEFNRGTHPRGIAQRYLAEGVQSDFFSTRIALVNPSADVPAYVQLRLAGPASADGNIVTRSQWLTLPPLRRATVEAASIQGLSGAFATTVESSTFVIVDRTVTWDVTGYGSSGETATASPLTTWYFAEGATGGRFNTFYLLLNPGTTPATATVTYLRAGRAPRSQRYEIRPGERVTVWVDQERWDDGDSLADAEVSARIDATAPIIAERSMYLDRGTQLFTAGHASMGLTAPATQWSFAEGATGDYFDMFLLLANPSAQDASVRIRFLVDGTVIEHRLVVPAFARSTVWVDALGQDASLIAANPDVARLANSAVSSEVIVDNGVGILAERTMWWPGTSDTWSEAHNSAGVTQAATRWGLAEGEVGGTRNHATYILIANPSATAATVRVTMINEDRLPEMRVYAVPGNSRFTVALGTTAGTLDFFPSAVNRRVGALIESVGTSPVPIIVERAMYSDAAGQRWAAGNNAVATRLP